MTRSRRSAGSHEPPEFCVDRNLGKSVPARLAERGWRLHLIGETFHGDAQHVADEVWIAYGLERGWQPLCKDGRIKGRDHEREPLLRHAGVLFYLNNQRLIVYEMVRRIHQAQDQMYRAVARGGPAAYAISERGIARTWP